MSSNKKIRNRLDKLFTGLPQTEREDLRPATSQLKTTPRKSADTGLKSRPEPVLEQPFQLESGLRARLAIPIQAPGNQTLLQLESSFGHQWQAEEQTLARQVADQLGLALQNAHLFQTTQKLANQMAAVAEIASRISTILELQPLLETAVNLTRQRFNLYHVHIHTLSADGRQLKLKACSWANEMEHLPGAHGPRDLDFKAQNSCLARAARTRQAVSLQAVQTQPDWQPDPSLPNLQSEMAIPIAVGEQLLGVLTLHSERQDAFGEESTSVMTTLAAQIASAMKNAILVQEIQKTAQEMSVINNFVTQAAATTDLQTTFQQFTHQITTVLNLADVRIAIEQPDLGLLVSAQSLASEKETRRPPELLISTEDAIVRKVYETRAPLSIPDLPRQKNQDLERHLLPGRKIQAITFLPLILQEKVGGLVSLYLLQPGRQLSADELRLAETLIAQLGLAVERTRLLEETQKRAAELAGLNERLRRQNEYLATATEVSRLITSTLELEPLFNRAVDLIRSRFGYLHVGLYTVDENSLNAVLRAGTGPGGHSLKQNLFSVAVGSSTAMGTATASGTTIIINDAAVDPLFQRNPLLPETRSEAGIPLKIGSRIIGALDIHSEKTDTFHPEEIAVLETLADQISIAIDNARSYALAQMAVDEMREIDTLKTQFLANMSHELRTPLNSIIGFSRVILKGIDGPITTEQQQDLLAIYNSGHHLLGLINNILDLSKIDAGKMELAPEELNLTEAINHVITTSAGLVKDKPIQILQKMDPDLATVLADPLRFRQVMLNLLSNAAKFTESGAITVSARLQTNPVSGAAEALISVHDTGPGISPSDQKKLFQAFSQVDSSPTRKTDGTGLGLSICKRLVEMQGGQIGVHSQPGKGSTFFFTLPLFHPQPADGAKNTP
jgi:signal transduction histidine kinase